MLQLYFRDRPIKLFKHLFTLTMQRLNLRIQKSAIGLQLDSKLSFNEHTNNKVSKSTKSIELLRKLQPILPKRSLLIIYKSFIRPHLDYDDVIYDQPSNVSFSNKIESVQYNTALVITGAIKCFSRDKLHLKI